MERYYISDTHFNHHKIIEYGERPFSNLNEMHDCIITNWNETVRSNDHITHLGDVTMDRGGRIAKERFCNLIRSLNGHKRLAMGNHDHFPIRTYLDAGFEKIYATWRSEEGFISSHFPLHPRSLTGATACVHGHIHQHATYDPVIIKGNEFQSEKNGRKLEPRVIPYINVSVEAINYRPIHLDEILSIIRKANERM